MSSSIPRSDNCPVCRSQHLQSFIHIVQVPVHCNLLWPDQPSALAAQTGDIDLVFCQNCGHVFNRAFDPSLTEYNQAYENSLHFSPRFQEFAHALASDLVERHDLHGRQLVEIGAGQGDFLRSLVDLGDNRGIGFDEAYVASADDENDPRLKILPEFAWQNHIDQTPDMIYARHVLEHIERPAEFVSVIRNVIGNRFDTLLFLEVPNMAYTLRELAIWDIIYEHCGYFTPQSLSCLLKSGGFSVLETRAVFGEQFLTIEAKATARGQAAECAPKEELERMKRQVDSFAAEYQQKVATWQIRVDTWHQEGKRVVAWGAGSKGVTFLNTLHAQKQIPYIVDINPRKLGMFVVGTGQEIVTPEFLQEYQPDVVILMNPIYRDEIEQLLRTMNVNAETFVA